eukprot:scaffold13320_cov215-Alexandrium_tamarense.AAC.10
MTGQLCICKLTSPSHERRRFVICHRCNETSHRYQPHNQQCNAMLVSDTWKALGTVGTRWKRWGV